jgi:hypothetical protein
MSRAITFLLVITCSAWACGQIIYQPVQYQHGSACKYYYGGSDPRLLAYADRLSAVRAVDRPALVFSDDFPYRDGGALGRTIDNAYNQAYGNVPLYFKKSDLLMQAAVKDGAIVVPPQAPNAKPCIQITPYRKEQKKAMPTITPANSPQPILIIPKSLLKQKLWGSDKLSA